MISEFNIQSKKVFFSEDIVIRYIETLNSYRNLIEELEKNGSIYRGNLAIFKSNFLSLVIATYFLLNKPKLNYIEEVKNTNDFEKLEELFIQYTQELIKNKILDIRQFGPPVGREFLE
jgi:hypothetical protein